MSEMEQTVISGSSVTFKANPHNSTKLSPNLKIQCDEIQKIHETKNREIQYSDIHSPEILVKESQKIQVNLENSDVQIQKNGEMTNQENLIPTDKHSSLQNDESSLSPNTTEVLQNSKVQESDIY